MKYDCSKEFDLLEIYRKLTAPSKPIMVKASEFFTQESDDNLERLQVVAAKILAQTVLGS